MEELPVISNIVPTIMCGGSGTRMWPLSRTMYPKQFLSLVNETSLLQDTLLRLPENCSQSILICNEDHRFLVAEQARSYVKNPAIILEPEGRNTAPALALAAIQALEKNKDAVLLVLASDHVIKDTEQFHQVVEQANQLANEGKLVTFGIVPTHPETGFGYIKQGQKLDEFGYVVDKFVEKPNAHLAEEFVAAGVYLWNSGMFMFKASRYLEELKKYKQQIFTQCKEAMADINLDMDFIRPSKSAFLACEDESIDYAVMENTDSAVVVPLDAGWSDVGSYSALWDITEKDENNNVIKGDVITVNSKNCYLHSDSRLISTIGVNNLVIVDTKDAILVANKDDVQDIKAVVKTLKENNIAEATQHRLVYRPWGHYDSIDIGERFQVKRITVKPGAKLSVQMHHHRAEHWIVVSGSAMVTINEETKLYTENQSCYIPIGVVHALENPGKLPLELIEVQSGSYLGEDDIVRFEDKYGRVE
ncbi:MULTISPECIES: mannose-1-phosphate guanylyltransferase/mannose-6-phosphate isomerase [unclassified Colwellia]|uniref:mannose-1-phosphate guanylyltransferase/mannose-6-phosphate isomerase n=1 Tax=unclassified Colwellia TaxID=196834 RepID=UPI0021754E8C|nr:MULTISPECIES: mannose-1-phosphate guanylyltransferase/mannose-6-phosphate isomerase [unclassified Colwellia]